MSESKHVSTCPSPWHGDVKGLQCLGNYFEVIFFHPPLSFQRNPRVLTELKLSPWSRFFRPATIIAFQFCSLFLMPDRLLTDDAYLALMGRNQKGSSRPGRIGMDVTTGKRHEDIFGNKRGEGDAI